MADFGLLEMTAMTALMLALLWMGLFPFDVRVVRYALPLVLGGCASAPPYQGLDSDQLFELGAQEFEDGDWDEVIRVFERFVFADPTNARMVEARLYLARAYFNR